MNTEIILLVVALTSTLLFVRKVLQYIKLKKYLMSVEAQLHITLSGLTVAALGYVPKELEGTLQLKRPITTLEETKGMCIEVLKASRKIFEEEG